MMNDICCLFKTQFIYVISIAKLYRKGLDNLRKQELKRLKGDLGKDWTLDKLARSQEEFAQSSIVTIGDHERGD